MSGYRKCRNCGDELTDVQWTFDPCPASTDGEHEECGDIICLCGNRPGSPGFGPCLQDGTPVEPVADGPWDGRLYICLNCGLIVDGFTLEVRGYARKERESGNSSQEGRTAGHPPGKPAQAS